MQIFFGIIYKYFSIKYNDYVTMKIQILTKIKIFSQTFIIIHKYTIFVFEIIHTI
jgi:hypothetical protein